MKVPADDLVVLDELQRILQFRPFAASQNKRKLLEAVVEKTLRGKTEELKEKPLGIHVFGRGDDFDPLEDSIVRTVASGVRRDLEAYYKGPGGRSTVRISLPTGSYVAVIERVQPEAIAPPPPVAPPARRRWKPAIAAASAVVASAAIWSFRSPAPSIEKQDVPSNYRITRGSGYSSHPAPSRDGKWIAFTSDRGADGQLDLWLLSTDQQGVMRQLTFTPEMEMSPDFSPNGKYLVYRSWREGGGIWRIPIQGGPELKLVERGYSPRYSPDGKWIGCGYFGTTALGPACSRFCSCWM